MHSVQAASGAEGGTGRVVLDDSEVTTTTKGSFISRQMSGLQYRKNECVFAMQSDVDERIGSRANRNKLEEVNMYRLAADDGASLEVVQTSVQAPRPGCKFRRKGPIVPVQAYA